MIQDIRAKLDALSRQLIGDVVGALPDLIRAVVLTIVALLVAFALARLLRLVLRRPGVEAFLTRVETDRWLRRVGADRSAADVLPRVLFWVVILIFVRSGADALGLTAVSEAIGGLVRYVPIALGAVLILLLGGLAARVVGRAVTGVAGGAGIDYGRALGRVASTGVFVLALILVAEQLGIDTTTVRLALGALLIALSLGFGLAFGLGGRDVVRSVLAGHYVRKTFEIGKDIRVGDVRGVLVGVTPTHMLIERDGRVVTVANGSIMESEVEQEVGGDVTF